MNITEMRSNGNKILYINLRRICLAFVSYNPNTNNTIKIGLHY